MGGVGGTISSVLVEVVGPDRVFVEGGIVSNMDFLSLLGDFFIIEL